MSAILNSKWLTPGLIVEKTSFLKFVAYFYDEQEQEKEQEKQDVNSKCRQYIWGVDIKKRRGEGEEEEERGKLEKKRTRCHLSKWYRKAGADLETRF